MGYESNAIFWIETEKIVPNPYQPRREFDHAKLEELAESIRMYGVLQPLVVTRKEIMRDGGAFSTEYELIAGERRLRASKLAGLAQVPVIIRSGEETELMKLELAIIENLQREDLNAVDRALAFRQLADHFGLSHAQVAQKVGRSREYVSNSIRLLLLPDYILNALRVNDISDGHARTLLMLNDRPEEQDIVFREILLKKLSVREVERISRKIATEKVRKKQWQDSDPELIAIEREFTDTLGTRVQIIKTDFGGKLTIDYFSPDELRKILDVMQVVDMRPAGAPTAAAALSALAAATPLAVAEPDSLQALQADPEPVTKAYPEEDMFTRHDSLEMLPADVPDPLAHTPAAVPRVLVEPPSPTLAEKPAPFTPESVAPVSAVPVAAPSAPVVTVPSPASPAPVFSTPVPDVAPAQAPAPAPVALPSWVREAPVAPSVAAVAPSVAPAPSTPEPAVAPTPEAPRVARDDESDLYSLKNFSL
jgi:ParB family chromosome partitioning protein